MKLGRMYFKSPFECCAKLARQVRRNKKAYLAEQRRIVEGREALRKAREIKV